MFSQTTEPNGDESAYNQTLYTLDTHGVVYRSSSIDLSGKQRRDVFIQYDALEDLYPTAVTNALGHTLLFAVHPSIGVLAAQQDVSGGVGRLQYDGFGRLKQVLPSDGANWTVTYQDAFSRAQAPGIELDLQYANGQRAAVFYDPYLREREVDSTGFNGQQVSTYTTYNSQGLVAEKDGPCFVPDANCSRSTRFTKYVYDELGRLLAIEDSDGSARRSAYSGLTITRFDELGNQRYTTEDQLVSTSST